MLWKTHPNQGIGPPVRPVDIVPKQGDGERVGQELVSLEDLLQVRSIILDSVDRVRSVAKIKLCSTYLFYALVLDPQISQCINHLHVYSGLTNHVLYRLHSFVISILY